MKQACKTLPTLTWQNMDKHTEHTYPMSIVFCSVGKAMSVTFAYMQDQKQPIKQNPSLAVYACKTLHGVPGGLAWNTVFELYNSCRQRSECLTLQLLTNHYAAQYQWSKSTNGVEPSEGSPYDKSKMP